MTNSYMKETIFAIDVQKQ